MTGTEILLIRHGQTDWNVEHRRQGHAGPGLNERGRQEAVRAADALQEWLPIHALYTSDLDRALETARIIGERIDLEPVPDSRLREFDQGEWTGMLTEEALKANPGAMDTFRYNPLLGGPPGGETGQQVLDRVTAALDDCAAQHPGKRVVVVSHGGAISMVRWLAFGRLELGYLKTEEWQNWPVNGQVIPLRWPPQARIIR